MIINTSLIDPVLFAVFIGQADFPLGGHTLALFALVVNTPVPTVNIFETLGV